MANTLKSLHFVALFVIILLANQEIEVAGAKLCQKRSETWKGFCMKTKNCDRKCRQSEKADHGACHWHFQWPGFTCFCYFNCTMNPNPLPPMPAPISAPAPTFKKMTVAETRRCERRSQTWFGVCGISSHCAEQCSRWENAKLGGYCDWDGIGRACFCQFCYAEPND